MLGTSETKTVRCGSDIILSVENIRTCNMKTFTLIILLVASCACAFEFPRTDNVFDWKLIKATLDSESQNTVISPFAVKLLLSLLMHSTSGRTEQEMTKTLLPFRKQREFPYYFIECLHQLRPQNKRNFKLNLVTEIFIDRGQVSVNRDNFGKACSHFYDAQIIETPFSNSQQSAAKVNEFYKLMTDGHIKNVVTADDFLDTSILFVNALYFQGTWKYPFANKNSFNGRFFVENKKSIETTFMTQEGFFNYTETKDLLMVELPYVDSNFSMHIILPNENVILKNVFKDFDEETFFQLKEHYVEGQVNVTIPKFQFDSSVKFKKIIQDLGIKRVFTDAAEIIEFNPSNLKVSNIVHKAGIKVDEVGTTAHATTVIGLSSRSLDVSMFLANRPFAYLIEDRVSGAILFAGQVLNPAT